ncbi:MAG TPA: hypothetical protein VFZ66_04700 [Herpetosiphonaceae bacterium]
MVVKVRLGEVIPQQMQAAHREHIIAFLEQEGIAANTADLGATEMTERQVKELLEELAEDLER